jgi:uncharacterized membrane protein
MPIYKRDDPPEVKKAARQKYIDDKRAEAIKQLPPEKRPGFKSRLERARKRQRNGNKSAKVEKPETNGK